MNMAIFALWVVFISKSSLRQRGKEESIIRKRRKEMVSENC
jgi:hypothetical protein